MAVLTAKKVTKRFGGLEALHEVNLEVKEQSIQSIIGPNGAGKTTTLKTISGVLRPRLGAIRLAGEDLSAQKPHEIVAKGVVQVPEGRRVFGRLTVTENLEMGAYSRTEPKQIAQDMERAFMLFPRLKERRRQLAGTLSGGEQQMLAMGRALMAQPKVLLLDEPSMGLAPVLVDSIFDTIQKLHAEGATILLVEQNARVALQVANRGYVLETGQVVLSDTAENLRRNVMVQKAYLGIA